MKTRNHTLAVLRNLLHASCVLLFAAFTTAASILDAATPPDGTIASNATAPVEWDGFPATLPAGGLAGEAACIDGTNCDVFTLHVSGTVDDWRGKSIVIKITFPLGDDADLYIHKDTVDGTSVASGANGGPTDGDGVSETAVVNPATTGVGDYVVHVLYSTFVPTDRYHGTATVLSQTGPDASKVRAATYIDGGISFSNNVALKSPANLTDGEPSNRTDFVGNHYVGGIRGFPAGVDLWYFDLRPTVGGQPNPTYDPEMRLPIYRGQPDGFSPSSELGLGGDGGGDIDLAVGFDVPTGQADPTLAFSSLIVANISTGNSVNRAETYNRNALGNTTGGIPADDRQWHEFLGGSSVYLLYRTLQPAVTQFQRSDDGGFTYGPAATAGAIGQVGSVDVHQATGVVYGSGSSGQVAVGIPSIPGLAPLTTDYTTHQAATDPNGVDHLFFVTKVADDGTANGTVYVCYSNDADVFLKHSTDQGQTWSDPVKVNGGSINTQINIFPWMETGPTPGSVGVVWYGTTSGANNDAAEWKVYFAQSFDATAATPTFRIAEVTEPEHVIHAANISERGLDPTGNANRNLLDYFQISFDPQGAAVIGYTDDHNDFLGNVYSARQVSGPSIKDGQPLPAPAEGSGLTLPGDTTTVVADDAFPPRQPGFNGEQVTDFPNDITTAALTRVLLPDPVDVTSIRYATSGSGDSLAIAATFKVSDLSTIPPGASWRASFAVNAPHSVLSPDGRYTFGASDHADQFFVRANTSASGTQTFSYGTAVRDPDGGVTYTDVGDADTGIFNQDDNTVSIQVSVKKLNDILTAAGRPVIANGTVVTGLRGATTSAGSGVARSDDTFGGTQFVVHDSAFPPPDAAPAPTPLPPRAVAAGASPSPTPPAIELGNIATRLQIGTGDRVGIGGFIIRNANTKRLLIRGIGPSVKNGDSALPGTLQDPRIEIRDADAVIAVNDNWRGDEGQPDQEAEITATGLAPADDREAAVIVNLTGGQSYTAIVQGAANAEGLGLVEIYDLGAESFADLGNISTRGFVGPGDDVLIGGFILRSNSSLNQSQPILVRGIGPSLGNSVPDALLDPTLDLYDAQGTKIASNDDWRSSQETEITQTTLAPTNEKESAILQSLAPGAYTAVLSSVNNSGGTALVEVYNLGNP